LAKAGGFSVSGKFIANVSCDFGTGQMIKKSTEVSYRGNYEQGQYRREILEKFPNAGNRI